MTRSNRRKIAKLRRKIEKLGGKITSHEYVINPEGTVTDFVRGQPVCVVRWTDSSGSEWAQYHQSGSYDYNSSDGPYTVYRVTSLIKALESIVNRLEIEELWK